MQIARARVDERAAPITALVCDGAFYDVAALEERWGWDARGHTSDFHTRIFGMRGAGLAEADQRLRAGDRPTEARVRPDQMLPLPPVDDQRAAHFQLAPSAQASTEPRFELRSARALVGDGQPAPAEPSGLGVEVGLAAVVAEELEAADPREARRAILGFTLVLDWTRADHWQRQRGGREPWSHLGPWITTGDRLREIEAVAEVAGRRVPLGPVAAGPLQPAEILAFLSQHVNLRPGDVVGLGALARLEGIALGDRVRLHARGLGALTGWAVAPAPMPGWRLRSGP